MISELWLKSIITNPSSVLCQYTGGCYSKAVFQRRVLAIRHAVLLDGRKKWLLYETKGFDFLCGLMALLVTGCKIFIPGNNRSETLKEFLTDETGYIGCDKEKLSSRYFCPVDWNLIDDADILELSVSEWGRVIFCSSGSTGKPKLIEKTAEQLFQEVSLFKKFWKTNSNTLYVPLVPHFHIYGLTFGYLLPLLADSCFYESVTPGLLGSVQPVDFGREQNIQEIVVVGSPSFARQFSQIEELSHSNALINARKTTKVSRFFCAGGPLTPANAEVLCKAFDTPVTEIYGSTETGAVGTRLHELVKSIGKSGHWKTLPGIQAAIVDLPNGVSSCDSNHGLIGFWGGHVGGAEQNPVIPGDEARLFAQNRFELLGRNNQICKIEGKRVSLAQLQDLLNRCEYVLSSIIVSQLKNNREVLKSAVVLSESGVRHYRDHGKYNTDVEIKTYLLKFFDPVLIPRSFRYFDYIPETDMGKISHESVAEMLVDPKPVDVPILMERNDDNGNCSVSLKIPVNLNYFKGHFSNRPIVPGVVLIHWVYLYANEFLKVSLDASNIKQLKFSNLVGPGEELVLILESKTETVRFRYLGLNDKKFSSGEVPILKDNQID